MSDQVIELRDSGQMRALAHPLRVRILGYLQLNGPSTATVIGNALGESAALLSYHLRQLARHGYVEEAPELGRNRKERPWRARAMGERFRRDRFDDPETRPAAAQLLAMFVEEAARQHIHFLDRVEEEPPEWRRASFFLGQTILVTPQELDEIRARLAAVLTPFAADRRPAPEGARYVYATAQAAPRARA